MKKTGTVTKLITSDIGVICDVCGKEDNSTADPEGWYSFNSHHDEWGNDSIDSYEDHDVCSAECYFNLIGKLLEENDYAETFVADNKNLVFLKDMVSYVDKLSNS